MKKNSIIYILIAAISLLLYSCANIGRPTGGDKDIDPPIFMHSSPAPNTLNFDKNKIEIVFDEIIQLKDQSTKVVVSPAQKTPPTIRCNGRKITITFNDTLQPNTTYTIDFGDAIQDNNEGNILDNFAFAFSTGEKLDTMRISGMVLNAENLEPMQGMIVGIHSNLNDSAFSKIPLERIARTNELGQFTLYNLKPGKYHIFALNDADRDYKFQRTEDLAFLDEIIVPSVEDIETMDTIFTSKHQIDTVMPAKHHRYLPNDVLLSSFNENYKSLYLVKNERPTDKTLSILFSAPSAELPSLEILKPAGYNNKDWFVLNHSEHNDTLTYWLKDSALIKADSMRIAMRYLHTDTLDNITYTTDTLNFNFKKPKAKKKKVNEGEDTAKVIVPSLNFTASMSSSLDVYRNAMYKSAEPVASIDQSKVHLQLKHDTIWTDITPVKLEPDTTQSGMFYTLKYNWEPDSTYRVVIDSAAVYSIYGLCNKPLKTEFKVKSLEEYSNLFFTVNVQDSAYVELLDTSDKVLYRAPVKKGEAELFNINPGTYYARIFLDANGNGKWDTGNYADHRQPEEVYYYPKKIKLKKNWDVEQTWNIYEVALDKQKPDAIKKNKPKPKKNAQNLNGKKTDSGDEEDEEDMNGYNNNRGNRSGNQLQNLNGADIRSLGGMMRR